MDRGFGTAYEKKIIGKIFDNLVKEYKIKSVCEYPCNNLMDNNSSEFLALGCNAVRQPLTDINESTKYDLVWCFCETEQQHEPMQLVQKMLAKSNRYILIVTQNKRNIGVPLHYIYHFFARRKWDHGYFKYMTTAHIEKSLDRKSASLIYRGAFDVPWFILDVYEAGSLLLRLIPKSLVKGKIKQAEIKPSRFEGFPFSVKKWLAHHIYIILEKSDMSS